MDIRNVHAVFFSPTGNAKKVVCAVADAVGAALGVPVAYDDFTLSQARQTTRSYGPGDLVVFGTPTYAGRIPNKLLPFVQSGFQGNGALAVPVAVFGNRSYDNALMELRNELEAHGFHTVSAAAFVGQHAFAAKLATGRPDAQDLALVEQFAQRTAEKVRGLTEPPAPVQVPGDAAAPYYTPLGLDGQPAKFLKAKPWTDPAKCTNCGLCAAVCPMGSIDPADAASVPGVCIKCQACVVKCPAGAKYFDDPAFLSHKAMLEQNYTRRAEAELFF